MPRAWNQLRQDLIWDANSISKSHEKNCDSLFLTLSLSLSERPQQPLPRKQASHQSLQHPSLTNTGTNAPMLFAIRSPTCTLSLPPPSSIPSAATSDKANKKKGPSTISRQTPQMPREESPTLYNPTFIIHLTSPKKDHPCLMNERSIRSSLLAEPCVSSTSHELGT